MSATKSMHIRVSYKDRNVWPSSVPWFVVEGHERQAQENHSQTLTQLAEGHGLSPCELFAILHNRPWVTRPVPLQDLLVWVKLLAGAGPESRLTDLRFEATSGAISDEAVP